MRTIVHLSDLHFGRVDSTLLQPLIQSVWEIAPDLIAVSGDLTQRARIGQFKEAKSFLDSLPPVQIVVPGNHDIPLDNPFLRIFSPLSRFKRYITANLAPLFVDPQIAVLGLNTTRRSLIKGGRLNTDQILSITSRLNPLDSAQTRVVVTHHPYDLMKGSTRDALAKCEVDVFLAGHLHVARAGSTATLGIAGHTSLIVQAGTATSTRGRGELNSFNVLRVESSRIVVETRSWEPALQSFVSQGAQHFQRSFSGWGPASPHTR
jgi:3',5'-cyclic AMP phosphodiesterase CpdA